MASLQPSLSDNAKLAAEAEAAATASKSTPAKTTTNSHNTHLKNNLSQYQPNKQSRNYQSRQRKASRSSQAQHDRRRSHATHIDKQTVAIPADEARYNLATRVMSNGVEVIVAGDKTTLPGGHLNTHLRILTTTDAFKLPLTLAPSTLKDHMLLMLPQTTNNVPDAPITGNGDDAAALANGNVGLSAPIKNTQILNELQLLNEQNQFVTKTCLTTYTYSTTYIEDGTTKIECREEVISNTATEERNAYRIQPTAASGITLTQTPHLGTGVFKTTYTYLNTIMDGEQPLVVTSQHTVTNTLTAPEDYLSLLQPSEPSATHFETNTYYSTMVLTKTLSDSDVSKVISTTDVVKQVVITELLPSKSTQVMTSYIAVDADGNESPADKADILSSPLLSATDVVKTYYVTYTYFNTYLVNGSTIVRTNVSKSSDIVTEKLYIYPTKRIPMSQTTTRNAIPIRIEPIENSIGGVHKDDDGDDNDDDDGDDDDDDDDDDRDDNYFNNGHHGSNELHNEALRQTINVYATKTFMTTSTYFTTLLQGPGFTDTVNGASSAGGDDDFDNELMSTLVNSHTRVVQNVVTESIPINFLPSTAIHKFKLLFFGDDKNKPQLTEDRYTTMATLFGGQALQITAIKNAIEPTTKRTAPNELQTASVDGTNASDENSNEEFVEIDNTKNELEDDQDAAGTSDLEVLGVNPPPASNNKIESGSVLKNSTKLKTPGQSSVSNLVNNLGSINFNNGLKVLRPMIDAVAGLINTNFRLNWNNDTVASNSQPAHYATPFGSQANLPPIPNYIENYANNKTVDHSIPEPLANVEPAKGYARNPIYIPVNANKENYDISTTQQLIENLTPKNFIPPEVIEHAEHINEIGQSIGQTKNKLPLIDGGGGIAISPGDVITTNSDVIFGRLSGNRPRIPLNGNSNDNNVPTFDKAVSLNLLPPGQAAPPSGILLPESYGGDSHSIQSIQNEAYIGPPPPILPNQAPSVHNKSKLPHLTKAAPHFNRIVLPKSPNQSPFPLNLPQANNGKPMFVPNNKPPHIAVLSQHQQHHAMANQIHLNRLRAQQHQKQQHKEPNRLIRPNVIPINHVIHENIVHLPAKHPQGLIRIQPPHQQNIHQQKIQHQAVLHQNAPHQNGPHQNGPHQNVQPQNVQTSHIGAPKMNNDMHEYVINNVAGGVNDIIEIQRIPEVYSTDLPPVHIYHAPQQVISFTAETIEPSKTADRYRPHPDIQTANLFPEVVESTTGQPLFVNIQPSQIAKVVIPHGSSSALIFGGVQELHKSGEYFDDPSPYPDVRIHSQPTLAVANDVHVHNEQIESGYSIISNQKVNVDSHVLSQDVDMHAPPLKFQQQNTNDIPVTSGTIGGAISNNVEPHSNANFPQITYSSNHRPHQFLNPVRDLVQSHPQPQSPFTVDIQSINLGMSSEDNDSNDSNIATEIEDDSSGSASHIPSIHEGVIDQHNEDDFANEQGEVIQESNAVPQLVSSDQLFSDQFSINQIPDHSKPTTKTPEKKERIPFTQTEANDLWDKYSSTTEYHSGTTDKHPIDSYAAPFGNRIKLNILPQAPPALVNELYSAGDHTPSPIPPVININAPNRISNNKHFINHQLVDQRPPKFANIGQSQHGLIPLQNVVASGSPPFGVPVFNENHLHRPHQSRRPISPNQKPFSRYPSVHFNANKPSISIATNYSHQYHNEPIKPQWQSSKPFDSGSNHFRPNVLLTTTKYPTSTIGDQTPQTSDFISMLSTKKPFTRLNNRPTETEFKVNQMLVDHVNATRPIQSAEIDLTRGKPFTHSPQQHPTQSTNLNIGEEKRPQKNETEPISFVDSSQDGSENVDSNAKVESPSTEATIENSPIITNTILVPFGKKTHVRLPPGVGSSSEMVYPKTPATEMQPPPTYTSKYKPYIQKHVQTKPTSNALVEEVMGLSPPPIPKIPIKQKTPDNFNNYVKMSRPPVPPHLYQPHKSTLTFEITAPTHHPEMSNVENAPFAVLKESPTSTHRQPITEFHGPSKSMVRIPYEPVNRSRPETSTSLTEPTTTTSTMTTPTTVENFDTEDLDEYVRFSFGSNIRAPEFNAIASDSTEITTETMTMTSSTSSRQPSNGHMPQSPQFIEDSVVTAPKLPFVQTSSHRVLIEPTATESPETVQEPTATKFIPNDQETLTITETKTTVVHSRGVTSTILLTLTKTQTSTVIDTVTHTLVKPTRVTYDPTIKPTIFTAPVTMKKISNSVSSIVPNPSFSIYYSAHDESELEHDSSNVSSEEQSFEIDDIHNIRHMITPTPKISTETATSAQRDVPANETNDSIFVVMTDRKKLGTININQDILHTITNSLLNTSIPDNKAIQSFIDKSHKKPITIDDVSTDDDDDDEFSDLPKRDEDDISNDVSHVLLGGILIATPPRSSEVSKTNRAKNNKKRPINDHYDINLNEEIAQHVDHRGAAVIEETRSAVEQIRGDNPLECQPDCKAINNEICRQVNETPRCVCRPGFARMFPDRPCKPTYTYTLHLAVSQLQSQSLKYGDSLRNPSSPKYAHLLQVVHGAIDRMVMQSDLRDIYHGVHVAGFSHVTIHTNGTMQAAKIVNGSSILMPLKGIEIEFHLQLSDNTKNEEQIMDIFKTYLQKNNFNLGGTNLYSSQSLVDRIRANDFDECNNARYHDCSENAYCFNLRGTYTCSCKDGFVDLSENPLYSGRICSAELMGCNRCSYHGACIERERPDNFDEIEVVCECFQWYAGEKCQYNLKVFLVGLIALGGILFALLLICIILTCWKHGRPIRRRRNIVPGIDILPHKTLTVHSGSKTGTLQDKRAMIEDTSSETSEDSCQLPYVTKKHQQQSNVESDKHKRAINKPTSAPPKGMAPKPPAKINSSKNAANDSNRGLSVMIPRAKYYSQQSGNGTPSDMPPHYQHYERRMIQTGVATATQGPATLFTTTESIGSTAEAKLLSYLDASPSTSKGFFKKKLSKNHHNDDHYPYHSGEPGALVSAGFEVSATVVHDTQNDSTGRNAIDALSNASTSNKKPNDHLLDTMVDWLTNVPENELIISEARSYGETLVHPQTKTLAQSPHYRSQNTSIYGKPLSTIMMDEVDTMAERDLGSTFLLPHTHLYKPDRASDITGFDSL